MWISASLDFSFSVIFKKVLAAAVANVWVIHEHDDGFLLRRRQCAKNARVKTWTKRNKQNHYRRLFIYSREHARAATLRIAWCLCVWLQQSRKLHILYTDKDWKDTRHRTFVYIYIKMKMYMSLSFARFCYCVFILNFGSLRRFVYFYWKCVRLKYFLCSTQDDS